MMVNVILFTIPIVNAKNPVINQSGGMCRKKVDSAELYDFSVHLIKGAHKMI